MVKPELSRAELEKFLDAHYEWLLIKASGRSFALKKTEIELEAAPHKMLFSFLDEKGFQTWRVRDFHAGNEEIVLDLSRNFERERERVRLVPRIRAAELAASLEIARLEKANRIAALIKETFPKTKLRRVALNKENGRVAQIVFEDSRRKQTAVLADVTDNLTPEILLSSAILWLSKLQNRRKNPIDTIWIAGARKQSKKVQRLCALLKDNWKKRISIKEISRADAAAQREEKPANEADLIELPELPVADLWRGKAAEIKLPENARRSETARRIIDLAPEAIDAIFSKNGETLRFYGLPFARVRRVFDRENVRFGVEKSKTLLTESNSAEFSELIENLKKFRRFDAPNKRHEFFRLAPEAWLEAVLRKNVRLLDANLILSPLYQQFRAERDRIDLLALRKDGRLVIIELKTAPDREMVFQAADYWRKIERQRRAGNLRKARLFGELPIADRPAVVYLVAPTLCFHRDFDFLAAAIAPEIELFRFNLAENWRESLKIFERRKIG